MKNRDITIFTGSKGITLFDKWTFQEFLEKSNLREDVKKNLIRISEANMDLAKDMCRKIIKDEYSF